MNFLEFKKYIDSIDDFSENNYKNLLSFVNEKSLDEYFANYINEKLNINDYDALLKIKYYIYNYMKSSSNIKKGLSTTNLSINIYLNEVDNYKVLLPIQEKLMFYELSILKEYINENNINSKTLNDILTKYDIKSSKEVGINDRKNQLKQLLKKDCISNDINYFRTYINYIELKNTIINSNLRLVLFVILKTFVYVDSKISMGDLIQTGNIGLIKATNSFDLSFNCKFSTYAIMKIKREIMYFIQMTNNQFYVPKHLRQELKKIEKVMFNMENSIGKKMSVEELSSELNMSQNKIQNLLSIKKEVVSLEDNIEEESDMTYSEIIPDPDNNIDNFVNKDNNLTMLKYAFNSITNKQKIVILLRYGIPVKNYFAKEELKQIFNDIDDTALKIIFNNRQELTLEKVGMLLNLSREWIRVVEKNALSKIRNNKILIKKLNSIKSE